MGHHTRQDAASLPCHHSKDAAALAGPQPHCTREAQRDAHLEQQGGQILEIKTKQVLKYTIKVSLDVDIIHILTKLE